MSEKTIVAIIFKVPPVWGAAVVAVGVEDVVVAVLAVVGVTTVVVCLGVVALVGVVGNVEVVELEQLVKIKPTVKITAKIMKKYFFISNSFLLHKFNIYCWYVSTFPFSSPF
jgi:hypothetical protein